MAARGSQERKGKFDAQKAGRTVKRKHGISLQDTQEIFGQV